MSVHYRTQSSELTDTPQEGVRLGDWEVASDLPERLVELRQVLGDLVQVFTKRFGRGRKQYSAWRKGKQLPPRRVLEQAAEREGWPVKIFAANGPRPKDAVTQTVNKRPKGRRPEPRSPSESPSSAALTAERIANSLMASLGRLMAGGQSSIGIDWAIEALGAVSDAVTGRPVRFPLPPRALSEGERVAQETGEQIAKIRAPEAPDQQPGPDRKAGGGG